MQKGYSRMNQEPKVKIGTKLSCGEVIAISKDGVTVKTSKGNKLFSFRDVERKVKW